MNVFYRISSHNVGDRGWDAKLLLLLLEKFTKISVFSNFNLKNTVKVVYKVGMLVIVFQVIIVAIEIAYDYTIFL